MADKIEVTSFGEGLKGSYTSCILGLILFLVGFPVLWINEGRAVKTELGLSEAAGLVVSVPSDQHSRIHEKKLIHLSGEARATETLRDVLFPTVQVPNGLRLTRSVEIYQWVEREQTRTRKEVGGKKVKKTTYHYDKRWVDKPVDSNRFYETSENFKKLKPINQGRLPWETERWVATQTKLGAFILATKLVRMIPMNSFPAPQFSPEAQPDQPTVPRGNGHQPKLNGVYYYYGEDPAMPAIDDVRVSFAAAMPQPVSVVGQQIGDMVKPFTTSQGTEIWDLATGIQSAESMISSAKAELSMETWIFRGVGGALMFLGVFLLFKPLQALLSFFPFLESFAQFTSVLLAIAVSVSCGLITISIAWFFYRPLLSSCLILSTIAVIFGARKFGQVRASTLTDSADPTEPAT